MSGLKGHLWLTRSQPGAQRLAEELAGAGFASWTGSVLAIQRSQPVPQASAWPLASAELVVVLSEHAVLHGQTLPWQGWAAAGAQIMAVGDRTAATLAQRGVVAQSPRFSSSEGLLEELLPQALVQQRRVLLLAGHQGRDSLSRELRARGADVVELPLYKRVPVAQLELPVAKIGALVASSGDGMEAADQLWRAAGGVPTLPVFLPSVRVVELAKGFGWPNAYNCEGAGPHRVIATLQSRFPGQ